MSYRQICIFCLLAFIFAAPVQGQDEEVAAPPDPALEAVKALGLDEPGEAATPGEFQLTDEEPGMVAEPAATIEEISEVATEDAPLAKDIVLVLDNSGSMKKNDPQFLGKQAAVTFTEGLDEATRVAIIIFDQAVRLAIPLTEINDVTRETILQSLDKIDYKGQWTESPAAIERAIYELKTNARDDAQKLIVFMTDGEVDTGNADRDLEQVRWLKGELAADAAKSGIRIFGIAYTENADFHLIQSIAQQTEGEYYRAFRPEDLESVFEKVQTIINKRPEPEPEIVTAPPEPVTPPPPVQVTPPPPPPEPIIIEVPVRTEAMEEEERMRSMAIFAALAVLIVAVIVMVFVLMRGSRRKPAEEEYVQEAYLNDINNYTSQNSYKLGSTPTMLGRVASKDTENLNGIVIPQTTIGRRHALIEYKDYAYWIIDQGSINGTFVNDQLVTGETRLKHGDKIRLHKYEFEFVMPEMVDAGMTVVSNTVFEGKPAKPAEAVTVSSSSPAPNDTDLPEPDFDLDAKIPASDEEETVIKKTSRDAGDEARTDETIILDSSDATETPEVDATIRPEDDDVDITSDKKEFDDKT